MVTQQFFSQAALASATTIYDSTLCVYAMATNSRKRKVLCLRKRVVVLSKIDSRKSCRSVAGKIGFGKTQIQGIVRDGENILKIWEAGEHSEKKYTKVRRTGYEDLDKVVWEWFTRARAKNILVSGKLIQDRAIMYAGK